MAIGLLLGLVPVLHGFWDSPWAALIGGTLAWGLCGMGLLVFLVGLGRLRYGRTGAVRLEPDGVLLPPSRLRLTPSKVPYDAVQLLLVQRGRDGARLVLGTRMRVYTLRGLDIGGLGPLVELHGAIRERMGTAATMRLDRGLAAARRLLEQPARATTFLLILCVGFFLYQWTARTGDLVYDYATTLRMGALFPPLVVDGEWFRLISATLLHGNEVHILFNGIALKELGGLVERLVGRERFIVVYVVSAICGSLMSMAANHGVPAVGASGAIFGVLGALFAAQLLRGRQIPPGARQSVTWWAVVLGVYLLALPALVPQIDHFAHFGGFLGGGLVLAVIIFLDNRALAPTVPRPSWIRGLSVICLAVFASGAFLGVRYAGEAEWGREDVLETLSRSSARVPELMNAMAWFVVIDPDANRTELRAARRVSETNLEEAPESAEIRDTLATAWYRLGDYEKALSLELSVIETEEHPFYITQVVRFAARQARKTPAAERGVAGLTIKEGRLGIEITGPGTGLLVASVDADGHRYGGLLVEVPPDATPGAPRVVALEGELPVGMKITPLALFVSQDLPTVDGARYWPTDETAEAPP